MIFAGAAIAVLLGACGGPTSPAAQPPPAVTSVATSPLTATPKAMPKPSPHVLSRAEAGKAYLAMVKQSNAALFAVAKLVEGKTSAQVNLTKVKTAAAACVSAFRASIVTKSTTLWPISIRTDMTDLIGELGQRVSLCNQMHTARTRTEALNAWNSAPLPSATPAEVIRAKLGLPPVPSG